MYNVVNRLDYLQFKYVRNILTTVLDICDVCGGFPPLCLHIGRNRSTGQLSHTVNHIWSNNGNFHAVDVQDDFPAVPARPRSDSWLLFSNYDSTGAQGCDPENGCVRRWRV